MNADELSALVDPPDPNAQARIRIWRILLAGVVVAIACQLGIYFGFVQNWAFRSDPKLVKQRLDMAFPGKSRTVLDNATQITLYSLNGSELDYQLSPTSHPGQFHGYPTLGQVVLDGADRQRVVAAFYDGLADPSNFRAACFCPHHGLRVLQGKQIVDIVICFTCSNLVTYAAGAKGDAHMGHQPEKYFNRLLTDAGANFDPRYKP